MENHLGCWSILIVPLAYSKFLRPAFFWSSLRVQASYFGGTSLGVPDSCSECLIDYSKNVSPSLLYLRRSVFLAQV